MPPRAPLGHRPALLVIAIIAWWTMSGLGSSVQYRFLRAAVGNPVGWEWAIITSVSVAYLWIPPSIFAFWATWKWPLEQGTWPRRVFAHLAIAFLVPFYRAILAVVLGGPLQWYIDVPAFAVIIVQNFMPNVVLYCTITGVAHAVFYAARSLDREKLAARLEQDLSAARLNALEAQLRPHFLFNALNTISAFIRSDPDTAERMVARLSELLRHTLNRVSEGQTQTELREELEVLESYLDIERERFKDRLRVEFRIDSETLRAFVPPLLLQPLVENAIRHGIAPRPSAGCVSISSKREGDRLVLTVEDDGVGVQPASNHFPERGLGLQSTRARLDSVYGSRYLLEAKNKSEGGVLVTIDVPFSTDPFRVPHVT